MPEARCGATGVTQNEEARLGAEIRTLAVKCGIKAALLCSRTDFHRRDAIDEPQHPVGETKRPSRGTNDRGQLFEEERAISRDKPVRTGRIESGRSENTE
jgi:hypothetical protein